VARVRVGIVDEHEIFRYGVAACLGLEPGIEVVFEGSKAEEGQDLDVAVVSAAAAARDRFSCPLVLCTREPCDPLPGENVVLGVLPRRELTAEQLTATVRAAAAGLHVNAALLSKDRGATIDQRSVEILRLLAQGAGTQDIAYALRYSERTIKGLISDVEHELGARSRAQAVAEGIRQGII
jgi:DNA-binding NarL/FixJ family response regulator